MIAMLPDAIGNHVFKVSVTDLAGQTTVQDLTFHYGQVTLETADLWQNTATLKIVPSATAASATLEYKRSTDDAWQQATVSDNGNGTFTAAIEPTWSSSTNEMGKTVYEPDYATGVFAGTTYDYRLKLDGTEKETGRFTTAKGDGVLFPRQVCPEAKTFPTPIKPEILSGTAAITASRQICVLLPRINSAQRHPQRNCRAKICSSWLQAISLPGVSTMPA